jgi:glycosyltransferase involved in cell wall biosynthesis
MKPVRVLQIVGSMNRGGVETWLKHFVANTDRKELQIDFLVHTAKKAAYDDEIVALGAKILRCPHTRNPLRYAQRFNRLVKRFGPYDVLHSHVQCFSGFALSLGRIAGIPVRIAHSHNDTSLLDAHGSYARAVYRNVARHLISASCTHGYGVSQPAAAALYGPNWKADERLRVLYCGIDLKDFKNVPDADPEAVRAEFGFSPRDIVFGHVGRFDPQKNHSFLIETAKEISRREPRARFLLVGDGPLRDQAQKQAAALGLTGIVTFAGLRPDIPRLMTSAMDAFLFPSVHEGLPLVLMETQAAGLRALVSEGSPEETVVVPELVRHLPLSRGVQEWARIACETAGQPRFDRTRALDLMGASHFSIGSSVQYLTGVYRSGGGSRETPRPAAAVMETTHG